MRTRGVQIKRHGTAIKNWRLDSALRFNGAAFPHLDEH
jgi:hypothetical protein